MEGGICPPADRREQGESVACNSEGGGRGGATRPAALPSCFLKARQGRRAPPTGIPSRTTARFRNAALPAARVARHDLETALALQPHGGERLRLRADVGPAPPREQKLPEAEHAFFRSGGPRLTQSPPRILIAGAPGGFDNARPHPNLRVL